MPATPPAPSASARLVAWLDSLSPERRDALARDYVAAAAAGGAVLHKTDVPGGREVPLPPLLTPEILDAERIADMERNAHALVVALERLSSWLMSERGEADRERLFRAFGPLEAEALRLTWREAARLATVRVDYLVDEDDHPRALEVNATIPAMQGYSDIVAGAFLREVGRTRGLDEHETTRLLDDNGRNADQLLASLLAHDALLGGATSGPGQSRRIAVVAREGDAQLGELRYLARRWTALGCPTTLATPAQVHLGGGHLVIRTDDAGELAPDLVYRHVFARRLDPAGDFARACLDPRRHRILNPINSHLEVKAMLALLSRAADPDEPGADAFAAELGLDDELRREIMRSVPWTRLLAPGTTRGPDGERLDDLVRAVAAEPARFVLKRSWDYGGRSVFLGGDHDDAAAERAAEVLGAPQPLDWPALVHGAATDPRDVWVVQALVPSRTKRHLVAGPDGARWADLYVDLSVYTNLGVPVRPQGGVSRAAPRRIVNLQSGGGLAPLLRAEVIDRLLG